MNQRLSRKWKTVAALGGCVFAFLTAGSQGVFAAPMRPPAVPLVTFDPYLSIWSEGDHLNESTTRHWTHREHALESLIRVDGKAFRLMGRNPSDAPVLPQTDLRVLPTQTIYEFENAEIHCTLTFLRPALPNDLDALALPLSYITWEVRSVDGKEHEVSIYDSTSAQISVNRSTEPVDWKRGTAGGLTTLRAGTADQPVLGSAGDDHRINWGYVYAAASKKQSKSAIGGENQLITAFATSGQLPAQNDPRMPRAANDEQPVLAFVFDLGKVNAKAQTRQVIVAYDEIFAINYFGKKLQPYWKLKSSTIEEVLEKAAKEYPKLAKRCAEFDADLMADAKKAGGENYAYLCALAYRQCLAACGLAADKNGKPLFFTKENTSNGDIATVDVIFPMAPQLILLSPALAKASIVPILSYAASDHWKFPNAPHDLGTYPIARGTDDGGEGMPVEESGNMLILCDALVQQDGNADFVKPWWNKISQWAEYLEKYGLDPENQLCTDDFMGHLAHNANLSIKAILGLAAYGDMCRIRGDEANYKKYHDLAKADAEHWLKVAGEGEYYRLAFDKPNTWSQKYNLVWDKILGLNIFPDEVARKEVAHYKSAMQRYGVPLDSRTKLTKTDWTVWSATLAQDQKDFEAMIAPVCDYLNNTTTRDPLSDSYRTDRIESGGMHARPVVGGIFIKMLADHDMWRKWASMDREKVHGWALLPKSPIVTDVVATAQKAPAVWKYTTSRPDEGWSKAGFDDSKWKEGKSSFGSSGTPGAVIGTTWTSADIWLRREITVPAGKYPNLKFYVDHDEDVEIYADGILAAKDGGFTTSYVPLDILPAAQSLIKSGAKLTIAVHCHQTAGGQNIDVGLVNVTEPVE